MSQLRLLLVEDSKTDADLLAATLREAHFSLTMTRVETAAAMSEALREGPWDIVVVDHDLSSFDAHRALALFKAAGLDAPFVVLANTISERRAGVIGHAGASDFALKGSARRVVHVMTRALREADERRARRITEVSLRESEQRHREEQAVHRLKDEFLAIVSHELRNPLNAILGWSVFAQEPTSEPAEVAHALGVIERNARAQAKLIDEILDMSRILSGSLRLSVGSPDLGQVIRTTVDAVAPAAAEKGVVIRVDVALDIGLIAADPKRLQQMMSNLVTNAVRFTPPGGHVEILARREAERIVIVVRDDGCGILPEFLPLVFEPFRQADGSSARAHGGLGLGLSIVKQLVSAHGGTVRAESEGEGRGAAFVLELPGQAAPELAPGPRESAPARSSGRRLRGLDLVVVDDEQDARELLEKVLTAEGATVHTASCSADALRLVEDQRPDVLVTDLGMPGVDGYALIHALHEMAPGPLGHPPAIALTAYASADDVDRSTAAGFEAHCSKPFEAAELVLLVQRLSLRHAG